MCLGFSFHCIAHFIARFLQSGKLFFWCTYNVVYTLFLIIFKVCGKNSKVRYIETGLISMILLCVILFAAIIRIQKSSLKCDNNLAAFLSHRHLLTNPRFFIPFYC